MDLRYISFFQLNNNNPIIKLLIKQKQNNLLIDLRHGQYNFINNIVEEYIDNISRETWKNTIKIYCNQLKIVKDITFVQYSKERISNKSLLRQYINEYPDENIKRILNKDNYNQFEEVYENLTPNDKEKINNWLKTNYIKEESYYDFYTYFVPLKIQKELETSNLTGLCTFKNNITIRIKIPENKHVKFERELYNIQQFDKSKVIQQDKIHTVQKKLNSCPKADGKTKIIVKPDKFHKQLLARILFFSNFLNNSVHIHIFESKLNKIFDWHNKIQVNNKITKNIELTANEKEILTKFLGPKNINTGYTVLDNNNITIYRKEELHKIVIHELIHALGIDNGLDNDKKFKCIFKVHLKYYAFCPQNISCGYDINDNNKKCNLDDYINENSVLRLNEGYTDTIADILNSLFYAIDLGQKNKWNFDQILNKHAELLKAEISFAVFQVAKLLLYFNFNDYRDLFCTAKRNGNKVTIKDSFNHYLSQRGFKPIFNDTGMPTSSKNKLLLQSTAVFSYFLIRLILLLSINDLSKEFEKIENNNNTLISFWSINNNQKKQQIVRNIIAKNIILPCTMVDLTMILIRHFAPVSIYPSIPDNLDIINQEIYPQELLDTLKRSLFS